MTGTAQSNQAPVLPLPRSMAQALAYISTLALPATEISLILDEGSSMMIWQQLTEQLSGAFRVAAEPGKVGIFRFDSTEPGESLRLRAAAEMAGDDTGDYPGGDPSGYAGGYAEGYDDVSDQILLGVSRRHLIFVVSDCAGDAWYDGRVSRALCRWAPRAFVSIMQPLPERFWLRSALREQPWVAFAAAPGISCNGELRCSETESELLGDGALIPVVAIEARSLATWSGWFGGGDAILDAQGDDVVGIYARVHPDGTSETRTPMSAAQRVAHFRRSCSTEANQLAGLLSAAPLQLPIIAAIMRRLAPAATLTDLAEVILSGLVGVVPRDQVWSGADVYQYRLSDELRAVLIRSTPRPDLLEVLSVVAECLHGEGSCWGDLGTWLRGDGDVLHWQECDERAREIAALVLSVLGGRFQALAARLSASEEVADARDRALLRRWRRGCEGAGDDLLRRHFERVERFFLTKVAADLDELVEATFGRCFRGGDSGACATSPRALLFVHAYQVLVAHLRESSGVTSDSLLERLSVRELLGDVRPAVHYRDRRKWFLKALGTMPLREQVAWELWRWESLDSEAVAAVLEVSPSEADELVKRAEQWIAYVQTNLDGDDNNSQATTSFFLTTQP
ncbi:MAG: hypothetical protein Tsb0020_37950 [Haliangiales bacterium]